MYLFLALALAVSQAQKPDLDVVSVVSVALEQLVPTAADVNRTSAHVRLGQRTLVFDAARTTTAFRSVSQATAPDYRKLNRTFATRTYAEAVSCDPVAKDRCYLPEGVVYATVRSVAPDAASGGYVVRVLVYWGVAPGPHRLAFEGLEQEIVVSNQGQAGWKVNRLGVLRVIN